jgi:hypothetical protein
MGLGMSKKAPAFILNKSIFWRRDRYIEILRLWVRNKIKTDTAN